VRAGLALDSPSTSSPAPRQVLKPPITGCQGVRSFKLPTLGVPPKRAFSPWGHSSLSRTYLDAMPSGARARRKQHFRLYELAATLQTQAIALGRVRQRLRGEVLSSPKRNRGFALLNFGPVGRKLSSGKAGFYRRTGSSTQPSAKLRPLSLGRDNFLEVP